MKHYAKAVKVGPYRVSGKNVHLYKAICECGWSDPKLYTTKFIAKVWASNHVSTSTYVDKPIFSRWG